MIMRLKTNERPTEKKSSMEFSVFDFGFLFPFSFHRGFY